MGLVGHNTSMMNDWSNEMNSNDSEYLRLVNGLYGLVEEFAGSSSFKGGLATEFINNLDGLKSEFLKYSDVFNECSELIKSRALKIDNDEAEDKSNIRNSNPLA